MNKVEHYIHAGTRENTRKSYRAAVTHFEVKWGGLLPATPGSVARYLADHADTLAINTLKQRLAGLSAWHREQGFPDPSKAPLVKKVIKGIAELHPHTEKRAQPVQLTQLGEIVVCLEQEIDGYTAQALRARRDRALLLVGFWRAFRSDELSRLEVQNVTARPGEGMAIYLPRTKTRNGGTGLQVKAPALLSLCPVDAWLDWIQAAGLTAGPAFRAINRWGQLADNPLHPGSIIGIIRKTAERAGLPDSARLSSHSLRRGFATWANANRWDTRSLMDYVGWKDVQSAMRYIDAPDPFQRP